MTSRNRLSKLAFGLGWAAAVFFAFSSPAFANGGESRDVVAPYAYLTNVAIPPSSGPYTTHYLISSATGNNSTMVNVKC
jgi:hypothetical protein